MEQGIRNKVERWKVLAEIFLKEDKRVFIKDVNDNYYFADILLVGEDTITIMCFAPEDRADQKIVLYWVNVYYFDEYKDVRK